MKTKSKLNVKFTFKPFSKKQLQVLFWWQSPQYKDKFAIIADGSVRAGKTVIMSFSYVRWAMMNFDGVNFGMAGKTIGSLRRNVIRDLKRMLISEHYHVKDNQSENMLTVSKNGKTNYFFLFGGTNEASQDLVALCPVKYTDQIDKNFRRLGCGIVPRSSRFCLCKRVWY